MAFVEYDDIKNLVPKGLENELLKPDVFANVEAEAGKLVTEITAVASPTLVTARPGWVVQPMAFIITKLLSVKMVLSDEAQTRILKDYSIAISFLEGKKSKGAVTEIDYSATGTFDNLTEI